MVDDEDWVLAQQCFDLKLWCFTQSDSINPNNRIDTGSPQAEEDHSSGMISCASRELLEEGNEYLDATAFAVLLNKVVNSVKKHEQANCKLTSCIKIGNR